MPRFAIVALVGLLAAASGASAQEWARKMFTENKHDFGVVARGSKAQYAFQFKNIYEEPLHVAAVRSSCGCTTPEVTKRDLKTWETGEVLATLNTSSFLGHHTATITVTFDKPFYAEVQLNVSGSIRGDVVLNPGVVELGSVDAGRGAEQKISVTRTGGANWQITDVRSANTNFEVEVLETHRSAASTVYDLIVRLKPSSPAGYIKDQLFLVTNDPAGSQIAVDVEGRVVADVTVSPASLSLGALAPGESVTKNVVVRSKRAFKVLELVCDNCFTCKLPQESREVQLIPITFTAPDVPGKLTKRIQFKTDLGESVVPDVTCQATILQPVPADVTPPPAAEPVEKQTSLRIVVP